ncbi:MAG TPA: macro domain-containing protein [Polyangiaceae bacterium]|nr:macro domain-containing protein [Polyangiaceae bacterium]
MSSSYPVGPATIALTLGDITGFAAEAIANAANPRLAGGAGVDGAIHRAAGPELLNACRLVRQTLPGGLLPAGRALATPAYRLPARYVIHCVGPDYAREGEAGTWPLLAACYQNALEVCRRLQVGSVAFPSIGTGHYGCPLDGAARTALSAVRGELARQPSPARVTFVLFDPPTLEAYRRAAEALASAGP